MPTNSEALRLNLEYYRKQAKALLKSAQAGEPDALTRISRQSPKFEPDALKLHDAQLTIAREQGFASWPRFRVFILQFGLDEQGLIAAFIDAAVSDLRRAEEILTAHPKIVDAGYYVDLVLGNYERVEKAVHETPSLATVPSGPQNCEALLYVCFSRYASPLSKRAAALGETGKVLLRHGANPNAAFTPEDLPDNPLPCLYASTGLNNNPELALALLEAGANPNDNESLYHSTEHRDLTCMKLLLRHGAVPTGSNVLKHALDRENPEGVQLLLAAGADPNEAGENHETALHWAVWRGRSAQVVAQLCDHGVDLNAQRKDGRTAYALAALSGDRTVASLLEARGANTALRPADRVLAEYVMPNGGGRAATPALTPEIAAAGERLIPDLASSHRTQAVETLLAAGMPVDGRGELGATALHWACWKGFPDLVKLLLSHGASLSVEDQEFHGTPPGWFAHGLHNCHEDGGDYPGVARLLIGAGAAIPKDDLPTGNPEVDAVLKEHGLI
ncbi:MAG TPA: ankyrin repeat domain-containing protein [Bryobacteraceae bacterium]|nr:ankyrin repeat domain-containing protein [Bryobacteraceae bacterium]